MNEPMVVLVHEHFEVQVPLATARLLRTVDNALTDFNDPGALSVPVPDVCTRESLQHVLAFVDHHQTHGTFLADLAIGQTNVAKANVEEDGGKKNPPDNDWTPPSAPLTLSEWDVQFFAAMDRMAPFAFMKTADSLGCDMAVMAAAAHVADVIRDKKEAQILEFYGLRDTFTEEQKEALRKQLAALE